jgi:hypothetical protein
MHNSRAPHATDANAAGGAFERAYLLDKVQKPAGRTSKIDWYFRAHANRSAPAWVKRTNVPLWCSTMRNYSIMR